MTFRALEEIRLAVAAVLLEEQLVEEVIEHSTVTGSTCPGYGMFQAWPFAAPLLLQAANLSNSFSITFSVLTPREPFTSITSPGLHDARDDAPPPRPNPRQTSHSTRPASLAPSTNIYRKAANADQKIDSLCRRSVRPPRGESRRSLSPSSSISPATTISSPRMLTPHKRLDHRQQRLRIRVVRIVDDRKSILQNAAPRHAAAGP